LSLANKKFKTQASAEKVMLTIFWDVSGPLLVHFQEKGQTVTSAEYSDMLVRVEAHNLIKLPGTSLKKRVLLPHDNTFPHTVDTLCALKFEVLKPAPCSPDLAPSDFHLFGPVKEHLLGQKFADDEVMEVVQSCLKAAPRCLFIEGIHKLVDRWTKCVVKQGDYVKK
jgi:hypothetical protein